MSPRRI